jgi:hypothetical protein
VDPSRLFTYGLIALFLLLRALVVVELMEELRGGLNAGIDQALVDGASGDIFNTGSTAPTPACPAPSPTSTATASSPASTWSPPSCTWPTATSWTAASSRPTLRPPTSPSATRRASTSATRPTSSWPKRWPADGIERLVFALIAIPTAIAEHFLRLALTAVAVLLYAGVPFAMLFAFFIYTQAFLGAYLKQFVNLLIETFMSVVIAGLMVGLLAAAALQGVGLYIAASLITLIVLLWRIKSALRLAAAAFDLFGGALLTGGAGGMERPHGPAGGAGRGGGLAGAALTGGRRWPWARPWPARQRRCRLTAAAQRRLTSTPTRPRPTGAWPS